MAHAPQHPHNPCSLDKNERTPAKIWELLRRNERFQKAKAWLETLDKRPRVEGDRLQPSSPGEIGIAMVQCLDKINPFAGSAIQWLVQEPLFEIAHVARRGARSIITLKLQQGTTPNPEDEEHWQTFEAQGDRDAHHVASGRHLRRRGPNVHRQTSDDPRLRDEFDSLKEWRDYFVDRTFTLDTPWREAPPQFRRKFCYLWRQRDSRPTNPITGTRIDAPREHETKFFQGPNPLSDDWESRAAMAYMFDELAEHYRVFAFPKSISTRSEARRASEWLFNQLAKNLKEREPAQFGSPLQWDIFLTVQDIKRDDPEISLENALRESFGKIHLRLAKWLDKPLTPAQVTAWQRRQEHWLADYRVMHSDLSNGLIQRIFPRLPA